MKFLERLIIRWKLSGCKTFLHYANVFCGSIFLDGCKDHPIEDREEVLKLIKKYQQRKDENCCKCKHVGLLMTFQGFFFTCRKNKYMCPICSLGNWCSNFKKSKDNWENI